MFGQAVGVSGLPCMASRSFLFPLASSGVAGVIGTPICPATAPENYAMTETIQNCAFQMPMSLARRLDAKVDAERRGQPVGNVNRSSIIRAALAAFLDGVPDPKAENATVALSSRGRSRAAILGIDGPRRRAREITPAPSPVRTRTRPVSQPLPAAE